jgi:hypothetical protein
MASPLGRSWRRSRLMRVRVSGKMAVSLHLRYFVPSPHPSFACANATFPSRGKACLVSTADYSSLTVSNIPQRNALRDIVFPPQQTGDHTGSPLRKIQNKPLWLPPLGGSWRRSRLMRGIRKAEIFTFYFSLNPPSSTASGPPSPQKGEGLAFHQLFTIHHSLIRRERS